MLEHEQKISETQAKESGKPDNVIPKIVEGKIEAFLKDTVLLDQPYREGRLQDDPAVPGRGQRQDRREGAVRRFVRFRLGEDAE